MKTELSSVRVRLARVAAALLAVGIAPGAACSGGRVSGVGTAQDGGNVPDGGCTTPGCECTCAGPGGAPCRCTPNDGSIGPPSDGSAGPPTMDARPDAGSGCASNADCQVGDFCDFGDLQAAGGGGGVCCPAFGCAPNCPNGVLKDANGCATCQCAPASDAGGIGTACKTDPDCPTGSVCGFPVAGGCGAQGSCFPAPGATCLAYSPGCACDGSEVTVVCTGLPDGYASKSVLHTGACTDGGAPDGGACCPVGWRSYSCTFPEGGTGMACHNPMLGCASSLTCGQGCDQVVTGQCP